MKKYRKLFIERFLFIFLSASLIISGALSYIYVSETKSERVLLAQNVAANSSLLKDVLASEFQSITSDLMFLANYHELRGLYEGDAISMHDLEHDLLAFSERKRFYDQIRFINTYGMEVFRINFNGGDPYIVPREKLQNKGNRYYFKDAFILGRGEVFVSPLDLNIEHGRIEQPLKPMIRFATPVFDRKGEKTGIVLLNYFGANMLRNFERSSRSEGEFVLLNSEGYFLKGVKPEHEWGFMYKDRKNLTFSNHFRNEWLQVNSSGSGQMYTDKGLFTYSTVYPLLEAYKTSSGSGEAEKLSNNALRSQEYFWKIVSHVSLEDLNLTSKRIMSKLFSLFALLVIITGIVSFFLSRYKVSQRLAADTLQASEKKYRLIFETAANLITSVNREGIIVDCNELVSEFLGYERDEIINSSMSKIIHPDYLEKAQESLQEILEKGHSFNKEYLMVKKDGTFIDVMINSSKIQEKGDEDYRTICIIADITELKRAEERIRYHAFYDSLSGLPNMDLFRDRCAQAIKLADRHKRTIAVLLIDLDNFKHINDTLGHHIGDHLLIKVSELIQRQLRESDILAGNDQDGTENVVARQGGDEFIILLPEIAHPRDAAKVAQRIIEALALPFELNDRDVYVSGSIGIAVYPADGDNVNDILRNADAAMYYAKSKGRNNYQYYRQSMNSAAAERLSMEGDLRKALKNNEFILYYQPQYDAATNTITGTEALIRWNHPVKGLIPPLKFIPLAEEMGLIIPMSEWVIETACKQNSLWQKEGFPDLTVSVNLTNHQFQQKNSIDVITAILNRTGLAPQTLVLEITESTIMQDTELSVANIRELADMGLRLAVDDFGTGYSSLSYLKRFPLHAIKIDRSFVKDVPSHPDSAAIVNAIISMAHSLKLKVTAEGVETEQQLAFLHDLGCDEIQGYLFSRPLPAEDVLPLLKKGRLPVPQTSCG